MKIWLTALLLCALSALLHAQEAPVEPPLLSIPGLTEAVAEAVKDAKAVGIMTLDKKFSAGTMIPIRVLHDSRGVRYLAAGPGGLIKQGEHFKAGLIIVSDVSAIFRKLESLSGWYSSHTDKIVLPDFWLGLSVLPPMDASFTWKSYKQWTGASLSLGF